jgi:acyl dehydratase
MQLPAYAALQVGDTLPPLEMPPLSRTTLALYAGASGDHNPVHIDIDFARKAGMTDVFAQGMLTAAYLGRLLTCWVPQQNIRSFGMRFLGITHLYHAVRCTGRIVEKFEAEGEQCVRLEIATINQYGEIKIAGAAVVAL